MPIADDLEARISCVRVTKNHIIAELVDGRIISVPISWSWRLSAATPKQRSNHRLIGSGQGIHWPDVDEDLSIEGLLGGVPAAGRSAVSRRDRGGAARGARARRTPQKRPRAARG